MQHENIHFSTDIIIKASNEKVWKVLSDLENWYKWTNVIVSCKGDFKLNGHITVEFANPEGGSWVFERTMFLFDEGTAFGWTGEAFNGLQDFHVFELEALADGTTKFIHSDGLHGVDVPGVKELEHNMIMGYNIMNNDLKTFVESH